MTMPAGRRRWLLALILGVHADMRGCCDGVPASTDFFRVLGVGRDASDEQVKRAYRTLALKFHPDKCRDGAEVCSERFTQVAQAYEALKDESGRREHAAGRASGSRLRPFRYADAASMFRADFGESIWRDWQPGATVQGVLIRAGKKVTMTIHPDGSVEESEELTDSGGRGGGGGGGVYQSTVRTGPDGRTSYSTQIHLDSLDFGALLGLPLWAGVALSMCCSWLPNLCCLYCAWRCCCRPAPRHARLD